MGTRSSISIQLEKPTKNNYASGKTIYCHWDGYPANNGKLLKKFYNTEEKVKQLIALGNLSILGESIGEKVNFDGFDSRANPQCLAYGRDRGEKNQEASFWSREPRDTQAFDYLFKNGKWYISQHGGKYILLTEKIIKADKMPVGYKNKYGEVEVND